LLEGEVAFVGLDVHKKSFTVSVWTPQQGTIANWTHPADALSLSRKLGPYRHQIQRIVYEAGPTGYWLCHTLKDAGFSVDVVAPSKTPQAPNRNGKSDRRDAQELARLAGKGMLTPIVVPTPQQEADRQLIRRRDKIIEQGRRAKQRIKSFLLQHGLPEPKGLEHWSHAGVDALREMEMADELRFCLDSLLADLDHAAAQAKAIDRRLVALSRTERHATAATLLRKVPGVGLVTAMTYILEFPSPESFETPAQVGSYMGLAPWSSRTGDHVRTGPIVKSGKKQLRSVLIEAAWQWRKHDPGARARFDHLASQTGSGNKAIVAVARHLAILLWRILTAGLVYEPGTPLDIDDDLSAA
jgi:transposase